MTGRVHLILHLENRVRVYLDELLEVQRGCGLNLLSAGGIAALRERNYVLSFQKRLLGRRPPEGAKGTLQRHASDSVRLFYNESTSQLIALSLIVLPK